MYHAMSNLWLRKVSPGVPYANRKISEKRIRIMSSKKEISNLPIMNRYFIRPSEAIIKGFQQANSLRTLQIAKIVLLTTT